MPLPMVHFQVDVHLFEGHEVPSSFLLGSIAPDAIHMRKNSTREDKRATHLDIEAQESKFEFVAQEYARLIRSDSDDSWKWFVRGYFAHLLTDYFWLNRVYRPLFKQSAQRDGLMPDEMRKAYYADTDQIDLHYYYNKPWKDAVWQSLNEAKAVDIEPYLTAGEIHDWRQRTIHWFDSKPEESGIIPRYITEPIVEQFCIDAVQYVKKALQSFDSTPQSQDLHSLIF